MSVLCANVLAIVATGTGCERLANAVVTSPGNCPAGTVLGLVALIDRVGREPRTDSVPGSAAVIFSPTLVEAGKAAPAAGWATKAPVRTPVSGISVPAPVSPLSFSAPGPRRKLMPTIRVETED